jgi:hypothetical protein
MLRWLRLRRRPLFDDEYILWVPDFAGMTEHRVVD